MILAIGERFNLADCTPVESAERDSFKLRLQMGLYNYGSRREFLDRMGVHWDHGINLLWTDPTRCEWDAVEARRTAMVFREGRDNRSVVVDLSTNSIISRYDRILLFGERVCDAFDVPYKMGLVFGNFVPLHHPVGDGKQWDKTFIRGILE